MADSPPSKLVKTPFSLRSNIAANIVANVVIAAAFLVSVPLFVSYIGVEGYGLVGFFLVAQSVIAVLDLGLNLMLTKEFAVQSAEHEPASDLRDLLRTSEVFYWAAATIVSLVWVASAGFLSWFVNPKGLGEEAAYYSFLLMGGAIALQLPLSLYSGGLFGLQRQAAVSLVGVFFSVLRNLGGVAALHYISSTPQMFFAWQLICVALNVPVLAILLRSSLPVSERSPSYRPELITAKWRFFIGIGLITFAGTMLVHVDKFVLARVLPLEAFGYYVLAAVVANGLHWLTQPVFKAFLPRLSQLTKDEDQQQLSQLYHQGCQFLAVILYPVGALWIFFSYEMMLLWQRDPTTASQTHVFVTLLVSGGVLNGLLFMPYALQLAFGWTRLQLTAFVGALLLALPLNVVLAMNFGGVGAAVIGISVNAAIIVFVIPAMHRRLLKNEALAWFRDDFVLPLAAVVFVGLICRMMFVEASMIGNLLQLSAAFVLMTVAVVMASSITRKWIIEKLRRR